MEAKKTGPINLFDPLWLGESIFCELLSEKEEM
jgi:hypothetical protein